MNNPDNARLKKILAPIGLALVLAAVFFLGYSSGRSNMAEASRVEALATTLNGAKNNPDNVDFTAFWKAWNIIDEKYVKTRKATSTLGSGTNQDRVYGAIKGMVDAMGDPYTTFFPPEEAAQFETQIDGNFEGVGMEMGVKDDVLTVVSALKGSLQRRQASSLATRSTRSMTSRQTFPLMRRSSSSGERRALL